MESEPAVVLDNVHVRYLDLEVLRGISWQIPRGAQAMILGPNGCGKSTLLRCVTGYGHVTSGTVHVLGERMGRTHVHQLRRGLGIVDNGLMRLVDHRLTACQMVTTGFLASLTVFFDRPTEQQTELARQALAEVGLAEHADRPFRLLSSGQQSRVWLARALVHRPQLLILDEPAAGLDLRARETLLATLHALVQRRPELTTLAVTHHLDELVPDTTHVLLMKGGRAIATGTPEEVLTDPLLGQAFDCPVHVEQRHGRWLWSVPTSGWHRLLES